MRPSATAVPHTLARRVALIVAAAFAAAFVMSSGPADAATDPVTKVLQSTNAHRQDEGLRPLTLRAGIADVSQTWSGHMKSTRTLAHNPNFYAQMPNGASSAAENVGYACGFGGKAANTSEIMKAWLKSSGHEANITGNFTEIGIGIAYNSSTDCAWATQNFGKYPLAFSKAPKPTIGGTLKVGSTVKAWHKTWSPTPSFSYRWYRDGDPIPNATHQTYTVRKSDKGHSIRVKVVAKKSGYKTTKRWSSGYQIS
ncbi:CAP domain-containing protein [Demequina phytophila]|uniref:CAP domain-containing protein n=1 Tax=Demequina phytophila TaxID=1638981 RepID=UPI00078434DA|nr:CAP domain-containing protein [Demequina phytophila]